MSNTEYITLDPKTRLLEVPASQALFGVKDDINADVKFFRCPRFVGAGVDLSDCVLLINYVSSGGRRGSKICSDIALDGDYVTFTWRLTRAVLDGSSESRIKFSLQAKKTDSDGRLVIVFSSRAAYGEYFKSDLGDDGAEEEYPDAIADLYSKLDTIEKLQGPEGKSAYEVALAAGFSGSEEDWLLSLKGETGETGATGESAYGVALAAGFSGDEEAWLLSLKGETGGAGKSAYGVAVSAGFTGTEEEWLLSLKGETGEIGEAGKSAYESALEGGFSGTEAEFTAALGTIGELKAAATSHDIIVSAAGESITVSGAASRTVAGLKVIGKTEQNGSPTADAPVAISCVKAGSIISFTEEDTAEVIGQLIVPCDLYDGDAWYPLTGVVERNNAVVSLDSTEEYAVNANVAMVTVSGVITNGVSNCTDDKCTIASYVYSGSGNGFYIYADYSYANQLIFGQEFFESFGSDLQTFKDYIAQQHSFGTPVTVVYKLASATTEQYDPQTSFTLKETTCVTQNPFELEAMVHLDYVADTKLYIDSKLSGIESYEDAEGVEF